jgi:protein PET117
MHQGVLRDLEQQRLKRERQADFDAQRALEAEYRKEQTVREVPPIPDNPASSAGGTGGGR